MTPGADDRIPEVALRLRGGSAAAAFAHREWSRNAYMSPAFRRGRAEDAAVEGIRACLRGGASAGGGADPAHAIVSGAPGSGKTRTVLEATRADDLAARVVYTDMQEAGLGISQALVRGQGGGEGAVLVVDNCDPSHRDDLWANLRHNTAGIDLVTIHSVDMGLSGKTARIPVGGMGDGQIAEIISGYPPGAGGAEAGRWVESCRRSPRAAHIVGGNLAESPGDVLAPHDVMDVWASRWAADRDEAGSEKCRNRLEVLSWIALFTEIGVDYPHGSDVRRIVRLAGRDNPRLIMPVFREAVFDLRDRGVLRGKPVLRIEPGILQDHMWLQWWEYGGHCYGATGPLGAEDAEDDDGLLPPLRARYLDTISRMRSKRGSMRAVERLFGKGGVLEGA